MFKNPFIADSLDFVIERGNQTLEQISALYNQLHHTAYIPKSCLLRSRENNAKTYNEIFIELNTLLREIKGHNKSKNLKNKMTEAEQLIRRLELSFLKIKNIKISSTDSLLPGFSVNQRGDTDEAFLTHYLSLESDTFIREIKSIDRREEAYHYVLSSFFRDIESNQFILNELQIEISKHLAILSEQINGILNENTFWRNLSSSIAKHYIVPTFFEGLTR